MSETVFDKASLLKRMLDDEDLAQEVIKAFLDNVPNKIVALKQALKNNDADMVRDQAHAVKGAAMNTSTLALQDVATKMEQAGQIADMDSAVTLMPEMEAQFEVLKHALVEAGLA